MLFSPSVFLVFCLSHLHRPWQVRHSKLSVLRGVSVGHVLHINAAKLRAQREDDLIGLCVRKINKKKQAALQPTTARKLRL